jgi:hypothetical protein
MSEEAQERLVTLLAALMGVALSGPLISRFVEAPEERGIGEDLKEAALKAGVTFASTIVASVLVRQLARSWR